MYPARTVLIFMLLMATAICVGQPLSRGPSLFRTPTLNGNQVAFEFADHIWMVNRDGGAARQLTYGDWESNPVFSPDGKWIAYTGSNHGNVDVYVMPSGSGAPRRLTYHPGSDEMIGWSPDSRRVLFRSSRESIADYHRLFTVSIDGGLAEALPMPISEDGCFSPDGKKIAYVIVDRAFSIWKDYRGGRTTAIRILDLDTREVKELPHVNANDFMPRWIRDTVYFLSDRKGETSLYGWDTKTSSTITLMQSNSGNLKSFSAGPDGLTYEQLGSLNFFDIASGRHKPIPIEISANFPAAQPHSVAMNDFADNGGLSPGGDSAVFETRGEIVTVSVKTGEGRNMTNTPGVAERMPAFSPDGKWLAYFSDATGEYQMYLQLVSDPSMVRSIPLGTSPSYYYTPIWSPDSKRVAYYSQRLQLWYVDIDQGKPVLVDTDRYEGPYASMDPAWSPDGQWLAYMKQLPNQAHSIFLYSLRSHKSEQLTHETGDAQSPSFDPSGQCIYFLVSTNFGPKIGWDQLSGYRRTKTSFIYAAVAPDSVRSQCGFRSLEDDDTSASKATHEINWHGAALRMIPSPFPAKNYTRIAAIKPGTLLVAETDPAATWFLEGISLSLSQASIGDGSINPLVEGIEAFAYSANGEAALYKANGRWSVLSPSGGADTAKILPLDKIRISIDPRAEWKQMLHEAWRLTRDFYYDASMHGKDWNAIGDRYRPYADNLRSRRDLNYLISEMLGELNTSHFTVHGGDVPAVKTVSVGLLGADYGIRDGHYYFKIIYSGGEWNPDLIAPLNRPGVQVHEGEYLMAVNGKEVTDKDDIHSFFENKAFRLVELKICLDPLGKKCQDVSVNPIRNERELRYTAWIENNQRTVDKISGGRVAYVHLPDTSREGYQAFNRYFLGQRNKDAVILDLRFNGGGLVPDYFMDYLHRSLGSYMSPREGEELVTPRAAILGPKVTLINEYTESGGETLALYFKTEHLGKVVGKRTWGGLLGRFGNPDLMDGGTVTIPSVGVWSPQGEWQVESYGVPPDVEVENQDTTDRQLAGAVEIIMNELHEQAKSRPERPRYPIFTVPADNQ